MDEVVGPDMVWPTGSQADAGPVIEPEPASLGLFGWNLQPLTSPYALHPLVVHMPAFHPQKRRDPPIPIAAVLAGQSDDRGR